MHQPNEVAFGTDGTLRSRERRRSPPEERYMRGRRTRHQSLVSSSPRRGRFRRWAPDVQLSAFRLAIRSSTARISEASGPVAQSGERRPRMAEVRGSSPLGSTSFFLAFAGKN
jgi:hypothetical protein